MELKKIIDSLDHEVPCEVSRNHGYDGFTIDILTKYIPSSELLVYSTQNSFTEFELMFVSNSNVNYNTLTDEEFDHCIGPELLTYISYYIKHESWMFELGDVFINILKNRYNFQSGVSSILFAPVEVCLPDFEQLHGKNIVLLLPVTDSEIEYKEKNSWQQLCITLNGSFAMVRLSH